MSGSTCLIEPLQQIVNITGNQNISDYCKRLSISAQEQLAQAMKQDIGITLESWAHILAEAESQGSAIRRIEIQAEGGIG